MPEVSRRLSCAAAGGVSGMTAEPVAPSCSAPSARLVNRRLTSAPTSDACNWPVAKKSPICLAALVASGFLTLAACGASTSPVVTGQAPAPSPTDFHAQTGEVPKIAYASSPVGKSRSYTNIYADEPGETWYGLGDLGTLAMGNGFTLEALEYQRIVPRLIFDYAPGRLSDPELEAQVRRAFKVWTRHLTGVHGFDFRVWTTVVEVGYAGACGGDAAALACVVPVGSPSNPYDLPIMQIPAAQAALVANANSPIGLFNTLAHEAGHALDYRHPGLGYWNPETQQYEHWHAPRYTEQLMSPFSGDSSTIGPQIADLRGVGHIFSYGTAYSPEYFGWWMNGPTNSSLAAFGANVARSFDIADLAAATGTVNANSNSVTADTVTSDFVKISSFVDGFPTHPSWLDDARLPAHQDLGSASWDGVLLAVDTLDFRPVAGSAHLSMNFTSTRLSARFDNFIEGPDWDPWVGPSVLSYDMFENDDGVWHDVLGRVDARFFASFDAAGGLVDPAHTAAGHLDDDDVGILGAYGAARD